MKKLNFYILFTAFQMMLLKCFNPITVFEWFGYFFISIGFLLDFMLCIRETVLTKNKKL